MVSRIDEFVKQNDKKFSKRDREYLELVKEISNVNPTEDPDYRYSLMEFPDGKRFVDINIEQELFYGLTEREMLNKASSIIKKKFSGKVIGVDNKMFVNGRGANEYKHPVKTLDDSIMEAKAKASTELDNLIDVGSNFRTKYDGEDGHIHPDAVNGFTYFDAIFKVGKKYFEGTINIINNKRGKLFKDLTKIKNITKETLASYGENPKCKFLRDVSMGIISQTESFVKQNDIKSSLLNKNILKQSNSVL